MIELERTFLAKQIPEGLKACKSKEIRDIYIPKLIEKHAPIRIRKNGDSYEITKKSTIIEGDHSQMLEQTIVLTREEFLMLEKEISGRKVTKTRYYYPVNGTIAEVDVFGEALTGLVLIDFEFKTNEEKEAFKMPFFCLADVTQEDFIAGGILCGKKYADLENELKRFNYQKLFLK
jgi:CYTH domain-containing protein